MSATIDSGSLLDQARRIFACPGSHNASEQLNLIGAIMLSIADGNNFGISGYTSQEFSYIDSGAADDDKVSTIVYKNGSTTIATLTFVYVGSTNNILSITKS